MSFDQLGLPSASAIAEVFNAFAKRESKREIADVLHAKSVSNNLKPKEWQWTTADKTLEVSL